MEGMIGVKEVFGWFEMLATHTLNWFKFIAITNFCEYVLERVCYSWIIDLSALVVMINHIRCV